MLLYIASIISIIAVSFLQTTNAVLLGGLKPNLVFALLVVLAHIDKNWTKRAVLILISALILKSSPGIVWIDIIFVFTALLAVALVDYLPWRRAINSIAAVVIGTIIINLPFFNLGPLMLEMIMNIALVIIFFSLFEVLYVKKKAQKENRL